jgi:hypothetical protein
MRLLMSLQLTDPVNWPLIVVVLAVLRLGPVVAHQRDDTDSVASAIFLILELSQIAPAASSARERDVGEKGLLLCKRPHAV